MRTISSLLWLALAICSLVCVVLLTKIQSVHALTSGSITGTAGIGICGDGAVDYGEDCDLTNLNNQTCISQGYGDGTLSCDISCQFETSECAPPPSPSPTPTPTPSPTPSPDDDDDDSCSSTVPGIPSITAAYSPSATAAWIYYNKPQDTITSLTLQYYAVEAPAVTHTETIDDESRESVYLDDLQPGTEYTLRLRARNNCAVGAWSADFSLTQPGNEAASASLVSVRASNGATPPPFANSQGSVSPTVGSPGSGNPTGVSNEGGSVDLLDLTILITDGNGTPLPFIPVTLYSEPQHTTTDDQGYAYFRNVTPGSHRLEVLHNGEIIVHNLTLGSSEEHIALEIALTDPPFWKRPPVLFAMLSMLLVAGLLGIFFWKRRKRTA